MYIERRFKNNYQIFTFNKTIPMAQIVKAEQNKHFHSICTNSSVGNWFNITVRPEATFSIAYEYT